VRQIVNGKPCQIIKIIPSLSAEIIPQAFFNIENAELSAHYHPYP
jgi:hypothetical protein